MAFSYDSYKKKKKNQTKLGSQLWQSAKLQIFFSVSKLYQLQNGGGVRDQN